MSVIVGSFVASGPTAAAPPGARVVASDPIDDSAERIDVYSPAMDKVVSSRVIRAAGGGPAPTLYLLTGIGGGADGISWWDDTDVRKFFADKHVNVVMPIGGAYSMYTDWLADDPVLGRNRWQTFFTRELPAVLDERLNSTGRNAIAGVSMSAASAVDLAVQAPDRYEAVAAYSGCPWTSDPAGTAMVAAQVVRGGGNPGNMWGVPGSETWRAHDAFLHADALSGKTVYLSAASGVPGTIDQGGLTFPPVESIANSCTTSFASRLSQLRIPATHIVRSEGSHTWGLFETDLHESWPQLARAIGA
ncbi:alpha/beta hydrolase [Nocardia pseudobrasiliensis]|uniref:S-formylglutathione hydrolase FrmB n=1 Tax=Nocardia pseudobrasiliensis TaxID=45979 RepID=A0A370I4C2_9NOCA|nr:alpha/beta hydrolase family protein [Nocardia pseudobrasiliensis]RDI65569.1 S-formylglutathione hydrolase FrmB [Nocardia pseudobrasiliensis]